MPRYSALLFAAALLLAGCGAPSTGGTAGPPDCAADESRNATEATVTVPRNGTAAVEMTLTDVGEIHSAGDAGTIAPGSGLAVREMAFEPRPHVIVQTLPAYYVWNGTQPEVNVSATVAASPNASLGGHCLPITVWDEPGTHSNGTTVYVAAEVVGN